MGPSGVGKTCVALRLAARVPDRVTATKGETEIERFTTALKAINVYSPPGTYKHGDYLGKCDKDLDDEPVVEKVKKDKKDKKGHKHHKHGKKQGKKHRKHGRHGRK